MIWESSSPAGPEPPGSPMDSPQLLHLAFLLLALAAPRPNIAMSIGGPSEGIEDYFTAVIIYRCKKCNSCPCSSAAVNFENYTIIARTPHEALSNVLTNETHTTVCFVEANSCLKETYGIYWQRDGKPGLACGSLSFGESGSGNISTEMKTVCCSAETGTKKHNPELKCYSEQSRPKLNTLQAAISAEAVPGNHEYLTSKKNSTGMSIGIMLAALFVWVCAI